MIRLKSGFIEVRERVGVGMLRWLTLWHMDGIVENNLDSPPGTIDLHGLYVKEGERPHDPAPLSRVSDALDSGLTSGLAIEIAIEKVDEALNQAKRNDEDELKIIVGAWKSTGKRIHDIG
jgi:hypothetical protein